MKIASTPCVMNERTARIWFSCFCCASEMRRSMPRLSASILETFVSAARQPDSDPTCEKPIFIFVCAEAAPALNNSAAAASVVIR